MMNPFLALYDWFKDHRSALWLTLFGSVVGLAFAAVGVQFEENISSFFDDGEQAGKAMFDNLKLKDRIVVLLSGEDDAVLRFLQSEQKRCRCAVLCYDEEREQLQSERLFPVGGREDLCTQAKQLFSILRQADRTDAEIIYAHLPPMDGIGLALYNRLIRAAAHTVREIK